MNACDIILKKRNQKELTAGEINYMIQGFTRGDVPEYQMSAFLMAVWFNKMTPSERARFTLEMLNSGKKLDLSMIKKIKVDKHSTGGVGDGPSLAIAPIVAAAGGIVPMMSGRGLGHTGGTLDKLASIPGFRTDLNEKEIKHILNKIGVVMMGQTADIAPADKKMYALRDVTATVDNIDLISASIMSKKLAEGMDALVLDVKTGNGAFMKNLSDAIALAQSMVDIGKNLGKNMFAYITDMNQPLGRAVGNTLEIIQAIDILKGKGPEDIREIILILSAQMLVMSKITLHIQEGRELAKKIIDNGQALAKLEQMIIAQNGNPAVISNYDLLPKATIIEDYMLSEKGYVQEMDTLSIGMASVALGAGRETINTVIDQGTGFIFHKKLGDKIDQEPILTIYANDQVKLENAKQKLHTAFKVSKQTVEMPPLIYGYISTQGFIEQRINKPADQ